MAWSSRLSAPMRRGRNNRANGGRRGRSLHHRPRRPPSWEVTVLRRGIGVRLPRARLLRAVHAAFRAERVKVCGELTIVVTNDRIMRRLNARFHHRATTTDVLAFPVAGGPRGVAPFLADVVISWDRARQQAQVMGHSTTRELEWLVLHGVLHLVGYRDDTARARRRMEARQRAVWARVSR